MHPGKRDLLVEAPGTCTGKSPRPMDIIAEEGGLDRVLEVIGRMRWVCLVDAGLAGTPRSAAVGEFSGTVYRICPARYAGNPVSMRGPFLHGARYNVRGYFGALYTSLSKETARCEIARYF